MDTENENQNSNNEQPSKTTKGNIGVFFECPECGQPGTIADARVVNMLAFGNVVALSCKACGTRIGIDNKELIAIPVPIMQNRQMSPIQGGNGKLIHAR